MVLVDKIKGMKNDKVKGTAKGGEGMKREARRTETARQKGNRRMENKNALLLSVSLCICLAQQSGSESPSSLSFKRAVTHSSALHSLATEGR